MDDQMSDNNVTLARWSTSLNVTRTTCLELADHTNLDGLSSSSSVSQQSHTGPFKTWTLLALYRNTNRLPIKNDEGGAGGDGAPAPDLPSGPAPHVPTAVGEGRTRPEGREKPGRRSGRDSGEQQDRLTQQQCGDGRSRPRPTVHPVPVFPGLQCSAHPAPTPLPPPQGLKHATPVYLGYACKLVKI